MIPITLIRGKDRFHLSGIQWTYCGLVIADKIKPYPEGPLDLPMCKRCNRHIVKIIHDAAISLSELNNHVAKINRDVTITMQALDILEAVSRYKPKVKEPKA